MCWNKDKKKTLLYLDEQYYSIFKLSCLNFILPNQTGFSYSELSNSLKKSKAKTVVNLL